MKPCANSTYPMTIVFSRVAFVGTCTAHRPLETKYAQINLFSLALEPLSFSHAKLYHNAALPGPQSCKYAAHGTSKGR